LTVQSPWRARLFASAAHLGISLTIAALLLLVIDRVWYPHPFFEIANGRDIFLLVLGCDLVLGPTLTLVVFNLNKPRQELVRDLAVIAVFQLVAMTYGLWSLLQARPAFIVYNSGQFNVTLANEIVADSESVRSVGTSVPIWGPRLVAVRMPDNVEERNKLTFSAVEGHGDVFQMPRYFVPYEQLKLEAAGRSRSGETLCKDMGVSLASCNRALALDSTAIIRAGLLPLVVRGKLALAIVNRETGDLLGMEALQQ
jgi:hypothetical protein